MDANRTIRACMVPPIVDLRKFRSKSFSLVSGISLAMMGIPIRAWRRSKGMGETSTDGIVVLVVFGAGWEVT